LLKSLAKYISEFDTDRDPADLHIQTFQRIRDIENGIDTWTDNNADTLITEIGNTLLLTLKEPYNQLINFSNTYKNNDFKTENKDVLIELIECQVNLYTAFIRTTTAIILSDFMESVIMVDLGGSDELKEVLSTAIRQTPGFSARLKQLLNGEKDLGDAELSINLMRNVVICLDKARSRSDKPEVFKKFVKEYDGNTTGSASDIAAVNSVHEILLGIAGMKKDNLLKNHGKEALRSFCDRGETALIDLFSNYRYVLTYEIITVCKVEANRQRNQKERTINHEILSTVGLAVTVPTEYGTEFAENYSVLLVAHRNKYLQYLSLSPFIFNVAPFLDEDKNIFLFFNFRHGHIIDFVEIDLRTEKDKEKEPQKDPPCKVEIRTNVEIKDQAFLNLNSHVKEVYDKRSTKQVRLAKARFFRLGNQFLYLEKNVSELLELNSQPLLVLTF
jgi:hypothetical protein